MDKCASMVGTLSDLKFPQCFYLIADEGTTGTLFVNLCEIHQLFK